MFSISLSINAKDYRTYYKLINKAEENFILKRDKSCLKYYDKAFKKYEPFLKDPFIASQIALSQGDSVRFFKYIQICFENGMPITALNTSSLIKNRNVGVLKNKIEKVFKESYNVKSIDKFSQNKLFLQCYQSDSIKVKVGVNSDFFISEDATRKYLLDSFLVVGKFPNERLFGITTSELYYNLLNQNHLPYLYPDDSGFLEEYELRLKCPFNIVLHSKCFYRENKSLFFQAMLNGYLHPKELGILEETSILWYQDISKNDYESCENASYKICYNIFNKSPFDSKHIFDDTPEGLKIVEKNRKSIFMQKYSVDLQKKKLEKEIGIKFFFDFKDR